MLVLGILIVVRHEWFLELAAILAGLYVAYAGAWELLRLTSRTRRGRRPRGPAATAPSSPRRSSSRSRCSAPARCSSASAGRPRSRWRSRPRAATAREELCDRALRRGRGADDPQRDVGATYPGWLFAQQEKGIGDQLRDGIRGLADRRPLGRRTTKRPGRDRPLRRRQHGRERDREEIGKRGVRGGAADPRPDHRHRDRRARAPTSATASASSVRSRSRRGSREIRDFVAANPSRGRDGRDRGLRRRRTRSPPRSSAPA